SPHATPGRRRCGARRRSPSPGSRHGRPARSPPTPALDPVPRRDRGGDAGRGDGQVPPRRELYGGGDEGEWAGDGGQGRGRCGAGDADGSGALPRCCGRRLRWHGGAGHGGLLWWLPAPSGISPAVGAGAWVGWPVAGRPAVSTSGGASRAGPARCLLAITTPEATRVT